MITKEQFKTLSKKSQEEIEELVSIKRYFTLDKSSWTLKEGLEDIYSLIFAGHGSLQAGTYGEEKYVLEEISTQRVLFGMTMSWNWEDNTKSILCSLRERLANVLNLHEWQIDICWIASGIQQHLESRGVF